MSKRKIELGGERKKRIASGAAAVLSGAGLGMLDARAEDIHQPPPRKPAIVEPAPRTQVERGHRFRIAEDVNSGAISTTEYVTPLSSWPKPDSWEHVREIAERSGGAVTLDFTFKIPTEEERSEPEKKATESTRSIDVTMSGREVEITLPEIHAQTFTETGYLNPEEAEALRQRLVREAIEKAAHIIYSLFEYQKKVFADLFDDQSRGQDGGSLHIEGITVVRALGETSPEAETPESVVPGYVDAKNVELLGPLRARHALDDIRAYCEERGIQYAERQGLKPEGREQDFTEEEQQLLEGLALERYGASSKGREYLSVYRLIKGANDGVLPDQLQRQVQPILERKRNAVTVIAPDGRLITVQFPIPLLVGAGLLLIELLRRLGARRTDVQFTTGYGTHETSTLHRDLAFHGRLAREHVWTRIGWLPERIPRRTLSVHGLRLSELSTPTIRNLRDEYQRSSHEEDVRQRVELMRERARANNSDLPEADAYWLSHVQDNPETQQRIADELGQSLAQFRGITKNLTFLLVDTPASAAFQMFDDDFQESLAHLDARVAREQPLFLERRGWGSGMAEITVMIPDNIETITQEYAAQIVDEIVQRNGVRTVLQMNYNTFQSEEVPDQFIRAVIFINSELGSQEQRFADLILRPLSERLPDLRHIVILSRSQEETRRVAHHTEHLEVLPTDQIPERELTIPGVRDDLGIDLLMLPEEGTVSAIRAWPRVWGENQEGAVEYHRQGRNPIAAWFRRFLRRP